MTNGIIAPESNIGADWSRAGTQYSVPARDQSDPILGSGASMLFVTTDNDLANPRTHKTSIYTTTGQNIFLKSIGKYKLTSAKDPGL